MRHYQRGIATSIILIIFLLTGVAIASGVFVFSQNQQRLKSINSFDDCAKYYPVMESYPEQCNTPDGKHFVKELIPSSPKPSIDPALDGVVWNDIHQIVVLVNLFYAKNNRLPETISDILVDPEFSYFKLKNNPINNQPYLYKVNTDNKSFEVSGAQIDGTIYKQEIEID